MNEATLASLLARLRSIVDNAPEEPGTGSLKENYFGESNTDDAIDAGYSAGFDAGEVSLAEDLLKLLTQ